MGEAGPIQYSGLLVSAAIFQPFDLGTNNGKFQDHPQPRHLSLSACAEVCCSRFQWGINIAKIFLMY